MTYSLHFQWQAEGDDQHEAVVTTPSQVQATLERLLAHRQHHNPAVFVRERPKFGPLAMPDHGIKLDLSRSTRLGAMAYFGPVADDPDGGGAYITLATAPHENPPPLYRDISSATPFPADAVIPVDQIEAALISLLETGERPTVVQWQTADGW